MSINAVERVIMSDVEVEVRTQGSGRDLLFLHPGTGMQGHDPFIEVLAEHARVLAASHPGFDSSGLPAGYDTVDDLAYFYLDLIEQQQLRDVVLVGASLGAWIAAEIAVKCRERLSALVLIGPIGAKFRGPTEREITDLFSWPAYEQQRFLYHAPERRERSYGDLAQADAVTMARNHESFARLGWSPTLYDPKLRQRLARVRLPTLVLRGAEDAVIGHDYAQAYADAIPGSVLATIPDAGHYAQVEQPQVVADRIASFLSS